MKPLHPQFDLPDRYGKDALIADSNRLVELDNQLCKLYDSIWGNTGCESGICPF